MSDITLSFRLGCYAWLLRGKLAFRWASNRERATQQMREDFGRELGSMYYLGQFGTVDAAERAAADARERMQISQMCWHEIPVNTRFVSCQLHRLPVAGR